MFFPKLNRSHNRTLFGFNQQIALRQMGETDAQPKKKPAENRGFDFKIQQLTRN